MVTGNGNVAPATAATVPSAPPKPRQAFSVTALRDYQQCPRMYYFARVLELDRTTTSFAGLFGQAMHWAISNWHAANRQHPLEPVVLDYEVRLGTLIGQAQAQQLTIDGFEGDATLDKHRELAAEMLGGYLADPRNQVELVVNEERFEVEIRSSTGKIYVFTGYIDQVRRHRDGSLHLGDLKTGSTRPSDHLLTLDEQLSLYAIAMAKGTFRARGASPSSARRLETAPSSLSLIMLRDYGRYQKDQYARIIKDPDKVKVPSPKTGKPIIREIENPKWREGYKKGEFKGPVFYRTTRKAFDLRQAEIDLARVCSAIKLKQFYRRPSAHGSCDMCRFRQPCVEERAEPI